MVRMRVAVSTHVGTYDDGSFLDDADCLRTVHGGLTNEKAKGTKERVKTLEGRSRR